MPKRAQMISPDAYPPLLPKGAALAAAHMLRSAEVAERGAQRVAEQGDSLRAAVLEMAGELEQAGNDAGKISAVAHEIRGLAESAGLAAAGRIANGLCRYFDEIKQLGLGPDMAIVALHVGAILRAVRHEDEAGRMSDTVAKELAALVGHKLTDIKKLLV